MNDVKTLVGSGDKVQVFILRPNGMSEAEATAEAVKILTNDAPVMTLKDPLPEPPRPETPTEHQEARRASGGNMKAAIEKLTELHNLSSNEDYKRGLFDAIEVLSRS